MCGIVGYVGNKQVVPLIIEGLRKLEYRGYDSAGIAAVDENHKLQIRRAEGKLRNLEEVLRKDPIDGSYGVGHTRWATHGRPTEENAHPHRDCSGRVVVVHNGIIENYLELKDHLRKKDHRFVTETDTEIIAHLIEEHLKGGDNFEGAVRKTVHELRGIFALSMLSADEPDTIISARLGPPVVIGLGDGEYFVASDIPAILEHTRDVFFLGDGEIAVMTKTGVRVTDFSGHPMMPQRQRITWDPIQAEKGGFKHFMLKEIYEQPRAVRETVEGRISLDTGRVFLDEMKSLTEADFKRFTSIKIAACGTSLHAGLAGKYMIEQLARVNVDVDYASEFRYRDPVLDKDTLLLVISQSGETADTIAAMREVKERGVKALSICNVQGSMITREAALKLKEISYIHAEGYPAGEMKHGPNALIDERLPVMFINTREAGNRSSELRYEKTHSNIVEVKAREGIIISILTEGDSMSSVVTDHVISVPPSSDLLSPLLSIIPLQLLAYHIAVRRGCDVDQPRNLAKSVTVE